MTADWRAATALTTTHSHQYYSGRTALAEPYRVVGVSHLVKFYNNYLNPDITRKLFQVSDYKI